MRSRKRPEIEIQVLTEKKKSRIWRPRPGDSTVEYDSGGELVKITYREMPRKTPSMPAETQTKH